jgi:hypothetical protein
VEAQQLRELLVFEYQVHQCQDRFLEVFPSEGKVRERGHERGDTMREMELSDSGGRTSTTE